MKEKGSLELTIFLRLDDGVNTDNVVGVTEVQNVAGRRPRNRSRLREVAVLGRLEFRADLVDNGPASGRTRSDGQSLVDRLKASTKEEREWTDLVSRSKTLQPEPVAAQSQ